MSKELEHIEEQLKRIERELQSLADQSRNLEKQQHQLMLRKADLVYGVTVGTVVTSKGAEYRVTTVDVNNWYSGKPWLEGNPKKKDGTWGTAVRNLYNYWEKLA